MKELTNEEIIKYANWIYGECDTPISEIEWLSEMLVSDKSKEDIKKEFIENTKELLKKIK